MRNFSEEIKLVALVPSQAATATVTGSATDVEVYEDDALAIVNLGTFTSNPTVTITITGSLVATPTTYNQILATFVAATAAGSATAKLNLAGIKNIKGVATMSGGSSPSVPTTILLAARPTTKSATNTSLTLA